MLQRLTLTLSGHVQGVSLRWQIRHQAQQLGLVGTVRNVPGGSVTLEAEGETAILETLLTWLQRPGHPWRVRRAEPKWSPASGDFTDFTVQW